MCIIKIKVKFLKFLENLKIWLAVKSAVFFYFMITKTDFFFIILQKKYY